VLAAHAHPVCRCWGSPTCPCTSEPAGNATQKFSAVALPIEYLQVFNLCLKQIDLQAHTVHRTAKSAWAQNASGAGIHPGTI
jgi:hypothetical protein